MAFPIFLAVLVGVAVLLALVLTVIVATNPRARRRELVRFANAVDLRIDDAQAEQLEHRAVRRRVARGIGSMIGAIVAGALWWAAGPEANIGPAMAFTIVAVGGAAAAVASVRDERHSAGTVPPDQRWRTPTLMDYVPRWLLVACWAVPVAAAAIGLAFVGAAMASGAEQSAAAPLGVALSGAALAGAILARRVARSVLEVPQPAESFALIWSDAFRGATLTDVLTAPILLGLSGLLLSAFAPVGPGRPSAFLGSGVGLIAVAVALVALVVWTSRGLERRYAQTLWATPAAPSA